MTGHGVTVRLEGANLALSRIAYWVQEANPNPNPNPNPTPP